MGLSWRWFLSRLLAAVIALECGCHIIVDVAAAVVVACLVAAAVAAVTMCTAWTIAATFHWLLRLLLGLQLDIIILASAAKETPLL